MERRGAFPGATAFGEMRPRSGVLAPGNFPAPKVKLCFFAKV